MLVWYSIAMILWKFKLRRLSRTIFMLETIAYQTDYTKFPEGVLNEER